MSLNSPDGASRFRQRPNLLASSVQEPEPGLPSGQLLLQQPSFRKLSVDP